MGCPGPPRLVLMLEALPRPTQLAEFLQELHVRGRQFFGWTCLRKGLPIQGAPGSGLPQMSEQGRRLSG